MRFSSAGRRRPAALFTCGVDAAAFGSGSWKKRVQAALGGGGGYLCVLPQHRQWIQPEVPGSALPSLPIARRGGNRLVIRAPDRAAVPAAQRCPCCPALPRAGGGFAGDEVRRRSSFQPRVPLILSI